MLCGNRETTVSAGKKETHSGFSFNGKSLAKTPWLVNET